MKKKTASPPRPQPAQIQAIERCLERGEINEADARLRRLQTAFPDFKPLHRLAFEVALERGNDAGAAAAWDWCKASPNSAAAFGALSEASHGCYPYLFHHALVRLHALGEKIPDELLEKSLPCFDGSPDEAGGLRIDLSQVFMHTGRHVEAKALIETLDDPAARNNYAQILFAEGEIEKAAGIFESVLAKRPEYPFTLYRLAAIRLWLSGKAEAMLLNERLQALTPKNLTEAVYQMESALLFGQNARADEIYRVVSKHSWYEEACNGDPKPAASFRYLGAMAASRSGNSGEAILRLDRIDDEDANYDKIKDECFFANFEKDVPDWALSRPSSWWPVLKDLRPDEKPLEQEADVAGVDLFALWQVPVASVDYLVALAMNGGSRMRILALDALLRLARGDGPSCDEARQALFELLRSPCGPDRVRNDLQFEMIENGLIDEGARVEIFIAGEIAKTQPWHFTVHEGMAQEETVLNAADLDRYEQVIDCLADGDDKQALVLIEPLLKRYPEYPLVLTAAASVREANKEPPERWEPLIRRAVEIKPDYFFSRIGMSKLLTRANEIGKAREMIAPLLALKEMHRSEWRALTGAQILIARAENDMIAAAQLSRALEDENYAFRLADGA